MVKGYKNTEVGVIPNDWEVKEFGELTDKIIGGGTPSRSNPLFWGNEIPWVTVKDFAKFKSTQTQEYITKEGLKNSTSHLIPKGTLITSTRMALGKTVIYDVDVSINQDLKAIFPKATIDTNFFYYWFQFNSKFIEDLGSGSTVMGISLPDLRKIKVKLPTKAEQTAIATALNDADALISSLEKLIAKKKAIKQGAVQELFMAKKGWQTKSLGDIANIRRGASPRPIKDPKWFSQKGRGWIRISDVTSSNVYLNSTTQYLSEEGVKYSVPVDKGDLIMSICATIGVPVIINIAACIHDGFVLFSDYENNLNTFYLYFFLQKETDALVGKGQPGTQKNLNISIVGNIEISYPSVEEQKKIGLILKDIDIELSGLEQRLEKQKQLKQGMMQSLLTGKIRLV